MSGRMQETININLMEKEKIIENKLNEGSK